MFCRRQIKNAKLVILLSNDGGKAGGIAGEIRIAKACDDCKIKTVGSFCQDKFCYRN